MRDAKGKGKETEKEEVKASTPGPAEESRMAGEKGESIGEHIQRNEEEFSAFLDGVEDLDGGFGHGVDSTESQDERSGRAATDPKRPFERRAHREPVSAGPVEDSGLRDIPSESAAERGHGSRGGYGETPEMFHSEVSGDPQDANAVPMGMGGIRRAVDQNIDGTSLGQSAHPFYHDVDVRRQRMSLAKNLTTAKMSSRVLNARIADGEIGRAGRGGEGGGEGDGHLW
ncbi:hypothetical protein EYC84_011585 [Monilinia fructicola]|uniref:Uncharacterized protein n=1 Tax=Monilinia fructicola TaxID=38448 RepID=A0A5M9J813_MONFR|nr:hypothetical protein EYC84_011585 [Monilinia fructicola]